MYFIFIVILILFLICYRLNNIKKNKILQKKIQELEELKQEEERKQLFEIERQRKLQECNRDFVFVKTLCVRRLLELNKLMQEVTEVVNKHND